MRNRIIDARSNCNRQQQRVCVAAAGLLLITMIFPPVYAEQVLSGMTDGRGNMVSIVMADFAGWTISRMTD
jgi:hypothetical protein